MGYTMTFADCIEQRHGDGDSAANHRTHTPLYHSTLMHREVTSVLVSAIRSDQYPRCGAILGERRDLTKIVPDIRHVLSDRLFVCLSGCLSCPSTCPSVWASPFYLFGFHRRLRCRRLAVSEQNTLLPHFPQTKQSRMPLRPPPTYRSCQVCSAFSFKPQTQQLQQVSMPDVRRVHTINSEHKPPLPDRKGCVMLRFPEKSSKYFVDFFCLLSPLPKHRVKTKSGADARSPPRNSYN